MRYLVVVQVTHKDGVADPQGATIERALPTLGFDGVHDVSVGKSIRFALDASDQSSAQALVEVMCQRFLTNPVIEDFSVTISELAST